MTMGDERSQGFYGIETPDTNFRATNPYKQQRPPKG